MQPWEDQCNISSGTDLLPRCSSESTDGILLKLMSMFSQITTLLLLHFHCVCVCVWSKVIILNLLYPVDSYWMRKMTLDIDRSSLVHHMLTYFTEGHFPYILVSLLVQLYPVKINACLIKVLFVIVFCVFKLHNVCK